MQPHRRRFLDPDGKKLGSVQSCIRTDDLNLVGDGSHLTSFEMVGNFSFGRWDYEESVELWHSIILDLGINVSRVHVHPSRDDHYRLWNVRGYSVLRDESCRWSDGHIEGDCCELFVGDLEIGNLVNPLGHSTDVGFGLERLYQVFECCERVEQTSLFEKDLPPIVSDHIRTIRLLKNNGIEPGNRGRGYVCRRLIRRMLKHLKTGIGKDLNDWIESERQLREKSIRKGRRVYQKFPGSPRIILVGDIWNFTGRASST